MDSASRFARRLIAASATVGQRQDSPDQIVGKFLLLFEKWEMAGIVEPDKLLVWGLDAFVVVPNQGRRAVWVVPPLKEKDRRPEVEPEFREINFHYFGQQYTNGELRAMDPTVVIDKGIFGSRHN